MALPFFQWAEMSWWGTFVRESSFGFAIASVFLLFGIVLLLGGVFHMCLRLLGLIMRDRPVSEVAAGFGRWTLIGLVTDAPRGAEHVGGHGDAVLRQRAVLAGDGIARRGHPLSFHAVSMGDTPGRRACRLCGDSPRILALFLWFGVGVAGRAIGFF